MPIIIIIKIFCASKINNSSFFISLISIVSVLDILCFFFFLKINKQKLKKNNEKPAKNLCNCSGLCNNIRSSTSNNISFYQRNRHCIAQLLYHKTSFNSFSCNDNVNFFFKKKKRLLCSIKHQQI